ncbi:family 43 glycosylhydrolase [Microbacterium sp. YJN-G]|uniref:family 43 glycosylhydrolase n=1 Tax=Microbacterium sp. YJN-G TaxID=2763257 RepID=UPI001877BF00|nr:family 43 glycosylhydrolase [Microbacterium sp. YJN-G]
MTDPRPSGAAPAHFCNPLDLSYRYQDIRFTGVVGGHRISDPRRSVHREAADPSIVLYDGRYFMFASMSAGFWHSLDLVTWDFAPTQKLPAFDYAPDVREIDGALYISASRKTDSPFFRSVAPLSDDFEQVSPGTFPFWDPHLYQDDDRSVYLYWGCDNVTPIQAVVLDPETLLPTTEPKALIASDIAEHGWERTGENYRKEEPRTPEERLAAQFRSDQPFIEGAWMNKRDDTYYLQYAAPATQTNTYADGYYTGSTPLGPFEYSSFSPFSSKPGGFITGAGHGSTFQDVHGNWWHAATMRICVNDIFERRMGLFPAGFDEDGVLFCNQNFADYPVRVPDGPADPWAPPPWMLLSYGARATASSSLEAHGPELAVDEDVRDWWVAATDATGESLTVDLERPMSIGAIQVNVADHELAARAPEAPGGADYGHSWRAMYLDAEAAELWIDVSLDGESWETVLDTRGDGADRPHALVVFDAEREARFVRVTAGRLPFGAHFAVSGLRVFGRADGPAPSAAVARARRTGELSALIEWDASAGAQGYNVRWGLAPDKLYHSWMLHGAHQSLDLGALNAGVEYWVAVDAFNGAGVTSGAIVPIVR